MPPAVEAANCDDQHAEAVAVAKAEFLAILANRHRLHILILLSRGECSVSALMRSLNETSVAVSRHLTILRENGVIRARRGGKMVYYSLVSDPVGRMLTTLADICWTSGEDASAWNEVATAENWASDNC